MKRIINIMFLLMIICLCLGGCSLGQALGSLQDKIHHMIPQTPTLPHPEYSDSISEGKVLFINDLNQSERVRGVISQSAQLSWSNENGESDGNGDAPFIAESISFDCADLLSLLMIRDILSSDMYFSCEFYFFDGDIGELRYVFEDCFDPDFMSLDGIVYIYNDEALVGSVKYDYGWTFVSRAWIEALLRENLIVLEIDEVK